MKLVDVNLLVYATFRSVPQHTRAREWLDGSIGAGTPLGMPWLTILGYIRVATNQSAFSRPLTMAEAGEQAQLWLASPSVFIPNPGNGYWNSFQQCLDQCKKPSDVTDTHLAALAIEYGLTLCSADNGFSRFDGLRWEIPLT